MTYGNNDQEDSDNIEINRMDDDLDYLYGERVERPIYASRSSLSAEPLPERYDVRSRDSQSLATSDNTLLDKECQLETQSGFMLVFKGVKDKATLSVRRKVGTPPSTAVSLTPDELRRLANLVGELSPEPTSRQRVGVGDDRPSGDRPAESEFDSFVEREYPELAQRRRVKKAFPVSLPEAIFELLTAKKLLLGAAAFAVLVIAAGATTLFLSSKPHTAASTTTTQSAVESGASGTLALENTARSFVMDMLNFRKGSYRQAQIRAMAMMTPELADRYWTETHFPLTRIQLKAMPQDQEVRIESITPVTLAVGSYQVDVQGNLVGASGTPPTPIIIRLSIIQDATGKLLVSEQKDITNGAGDSPTASAATPSAEPILAPAMAPAVAPPAQSVAPAVAPSAVSIPPVAPSPSASTATPATAATTAPAAAPTSAPAPASAPEGAQAPGTVSGGSQD